MNARGSNKKGNNPNNMSHHQKLEEAKKKDAQKEQECMVKYGVTPDQLEGVKHK